MIVTAAPTIGNLTIGVIYPLKFGMLERFSDNIKVTAVANGIAEITYYASDALTILSTGQMAVTTPCWVISLLQ